MQNLTRPWACAVVISLAALAVGALWLAVPGSYPYGAASRVTVGVNHWIERGPGAALLLASGALGLLLTAVRRSWPGPASAGAVLEAAFFLLVMSDAAVLSSLGYALIPLSAAALLGLIVVGCLRRHPAGYAAAALVAAAVAGPATGLVDAGPVAGYLGNLGKGFGDFGVRIAWSWGMAAGAAGWAWVALAALRPVSAAVAGPRRWGRVVTVLAALGAAPYALARISWATPWPLFGFDPRTDRMVVLISGMDAATRLQGFLIGLGSLAAVVLTFGLISRWGEVFPRWLPVVGGREVPVRAAVGAGTAGAAALCVSAPGVLAGAVQNSAWLDGVLFVVLFPCPVWGPLLAAAVYAYWVRRRTVTKPL
ncbi:hypothetical protein ACIBHY_08790 [Nonomuraea sp. NPDC050547]|uniref:hypothetical protein n=1 Tax=Nonomuraea sp. NPDC050547 TaxID=3364368 RepID=UPI0037A17CC8